MCSFRSPPSSPFPPPPAFPSRPPAPNKHLSLLFIARLSSPPLPLPPSCTSSVPLHPTAFSPFHSVCLFLPAYLFQRCFIPPRLPRLILPASPPSPSYPRLLPPPSASSPSHDEQESSIISPSSLNSRTMRNWSDVITFWSERSLGVSKRSAFKMYYCHPASACGGGGGGGGAAGDGGYGQRKRERNQWRGERWWSRRG